MGSNPCKQLVEGGGRIGKEEFESLLSRYDKGLVFQPWLRFLLSTNFSSKDKNGLLDQDEASRFLKDLCKALGTKYDKHNAARIINRCDKGFPTCFPQIWTLKKKLMLSEGKGLLSINEFSNLFQEAILEAESSGNVKAKKVVLEFSDNPSNS